MNFKEISIFGFRSIEEIKISDLKQVNLFVGRNNCGKTSILESLFMITGISNPKIPITLNQFRDIKYILGDNKDYKLIFNQLNYQKGIKIKAVIGNQQRELVIKPHYQKEVGGEISTIDENSFKKPNYDSLSETSNITGLDYSFTVDNNKFKSSIYRRGLGYEQLAPKEYTETIVGTYVSSESIFQLLPNRLNSLIVRKKISGIIKVLQKIDANIINISIGTDQLIYFDTGLSELVPINVMGDGIRRLLSIIVTIANQKDGFVFIDEIENGFHHKTLKVLWETIFDAAREYNVQIFATTHSYECIKSFQKAHSYNKHPNNEDDIKLFRIENNKEKHIAHSFSHEELKDLLNENWEIR